MRCNEKAENDINFYTIDGIKIGTENDINLEFYRKQQRQAAT